MSPLSAAAQNVLANLGYRVETSIDAFHACYLEAGAGPPVAWVRPDEDGTWQVAIARHIVPKLTEAPFNRVRAEDDLPEEAAFVVTVADRDELYGLCELIARAYMRPLERAPLEERATTHPAATLPASQLLATLDDLLDDIDAGVVHPETTVKALREIRIGQERFRAALLAHWHGACAVTGLTVQRLLRASHCKPWAVSSAEERLDPANGLLLAAHLDAAFDVGYISFADNGAMLCAPELDARAMQALGLRAGLRLREVRQDHLPYLHWHRAHLFSRHPVHLSR